MKKVEETKKYDAMTLDQLEKDLLEIEKKVAEAILRVTAGKLGDYSQVKKLKKSVARIKTFISKKAE